MLVVNEVHVRYGGIGAVRGASLRVEHNEFVTLIGANGAGKTSLLRAISGLVGTAAGRVEFDGVPITGRPAERIARMGLVHVPEGRRVFPRMSVRENLLVAGWGERHQTTARLKRVEEWFPILSDRASQAAFSLSGGEQQMLAIGRGLMRQPKLLMLDEPSMGLAPMVARAIFELLREIHDAGTAILLVEQNARMALECAERAYVLERGEIVTAGAAAELAGSDQVRRAYLGAV
jgi:branched-chain amino acid transport system ATP-binding protein